MMVLEAEEAHVRRRTGMRSFVYFGTDYRPPLSVG
jgi:hypothetical protein